MRVLCVAEKPSQAKEIATKLSDATATSRTGLDPYCRNYDFTLVWQGRRCDFVVTSLVGHVQELDFELEYRKWRSCPPAALFNLPIIKAVAKDKLKVVKNLQEEARRADVVMVWTDCDREGENIGAEVVELARAVNPRLEICRARFSVMQARDLKLACQSPATLDQRQVDAVDARSEVDLRIGAALTRFQTLTLQSQFEPLRSGVISYGSCQFPTLGFVVERYLKRRDFIPEEFSRIAMSYTKDGIDVAFNWARGQLYDPVVCLLLYEKCMEDCTAHVVDYKSRPTTKWRPLPLTTVELQKMGSKYLQLPSDKVMEAANSLYQKGFISYPRTETDRFDPSFEFQPLLQKQLAISQWSDYCRRLLAGDFNTPRAGKHNDGSHPPIHPTAAAPELTGDERKVYEFVLRRFLATCSKDATGQRTSVEVDIAGERFTAKGLRILDPNYLEIYPYDKWSDKVLPPFQIGETFVPAVLEMVDGTTSPPTLLTEAELIGIMSRNGIGTDATIHEHIHKVLIRNYVYKDHQQRFAPSELGIGLVEGYDQIGLEKSLSKPFLRREFELSLKGICDGSRIKTAEVQSALAMYFEMFTVTTQNVAALIQAIAKYIPISSDAAPPNLSVARQPTQPVLTCPACSGSIALRSSNEKLYLGCSNYPNCHESVWFPVGKFSQISVEPSCCPRCQTLGCQVKLLRFHLTDPQMQMHLGQEYVGCVSCDETLHNMAGVRLAPRPTPTPRGAPLPDVALPQPNPSIEMFRSILNANPCVQPPKCRCDLFAVKLQAVGAGENRGRWYFKCPSNRSCGFFSWIDTDDFPPPGPNTASGRRDLACFRCNQPGHFAAACPKLTAGSATRGRVNPPASGVTCFRCHKPGHLSTACPQTGSTRGGTRGRGSRARRARTRGGSKRRS